MKYLLQFGIIMAISFAGELLHDFLPLPVPASIYGILILFSLLRFKILHVAQIKETAMFLISIMAFLFLPAAVGLVVAWPVMKSILQYIAANVLSLIACMAGTGFAAQFLLSRLQKKENPKEASHDFSS
jgi:holin-like protein